MYRSRKCLAPNHIIAKVAGSLNANEISYVLIHKFGGEKIIELGIRRLNQGLDHFIHSKRHCVQKDMYRPTSLKC